MLDEANSKGFNKTMLFAFFESIKYVGNALPLTFLRIFLGYTYLNHALVKINSDYLLRPRLAEMISEFLPVSQAPEWYKLFLANQVIHHWQIAGFFWVGIELAIGCSYLVGYVVRPTAIVATLFTFATLFVSNPVLLDSYKLIVACHLVLAWAGAGRCLGIDYYFYKRRRGLWW